MHRLLAILLLVAIASCASYPPEDDPFFREPKKDEPHALLIYQSGGLFNKPVFAETINGKLANETGKLTGREWRVPPGTVSLYICAEVSMSEAAYDEFEFPVQQGTSYFIYRSITDAGVEVYVMENDTKKIYSNVVPPEKKRPPKFQVLPIIII